MRPFALGIGLICPYSFDVHGGVQNHVTGLARHLAGAGHRVAILAPGERPDGIDVPFTSAGAAVPVPYNGSIARVNFGPLSAARVHRWLARQRLDLVHIHEPITPSIALLALRAAEVPVVATFHTATPRSRTMQVAGGALRASIAKIDAGIAVSESARRVVVHHLGRDAVVVPNGFDFAAFERPGLPVDGKPGAWRGGARPRVTFLGRLDEPRKGLDVLLAALPAIRRHRPDVDVVLAGQGNLPAVAGTRHVGAISDPAKRELLARTDVFVAPHVARESFGIVLLEAMAAGASVVAADLPAFHDLVAAPAYGRTYRRGDPAALAAAVSAELGSPDLLRRARARERARGYDWSRIGPAVTEVYRATLAGGWAALDAALTRRARRSIEAAAAPGVDSATRLLVRDAAAAALAARTPDDRERAESTLTHVLAAAGLDGVEAEQDHVAVVRRLHNVVAAGAGAGAGAVGRGRTGAPRAFEMADPTPLPWARGRAAP